MYPYLILLACAVYLLIKLTALRKAKKKLMSLEELDRHLITTLNSEVQTHDK